MTFGPDLGDYAHLDPSAMTPAELAAVAEAIDRRRPVDMVDPDGTVVAVPAQRVPERLAAGYTLTDNPEEQQ